jgi:hypothetical protein
MVSRKIQYALNKQAVYVCIYLSFLNHKILESVPVAVQIDITIYSIIRYL